MLQYAIRQSLGDNNTTSGEQSEQVCRSQVRHERQVTSEVEVTSARSQQQI